MKNIRPVIQGDYVATPVKNAFNNKTSYWLSKKGYTISMYMFTVEGNGESEREFEERLSEKGFRAYIPSFEELITRRPIYSRDNITIITLNSDGDQIETSMPVNELIQDWYREIDIPKNEDTVVACLLGTTQLYFETFGELMTALTGEQ